jgi:cell division protein FtsW
VQDFFEGSGARRREIERSASRPNRVPRKSFAEPRVLTIQKYNFMKTIKVDIPFLISIGILIVGGFLIFSSASLGLLSSNSTTYSSVSFNQTFFGLFLGLLACIITSQIDYKIYRDYSFWIFIFSIFATLLVFVPHIGSSHGGAARWIYIGSLSFQTSELLKIGFIMYLSAWLSVKDKAKTFRNGFLPFAILSLIVGLILLKQPDTDTFLITFFAGIAIFLTAGGKWRYMMILAMIGAMGIGVLAIERPYLMSRFTTFLNPGQNSLTSGYQIEQSLIAVGSGGLTGRGFGQSIQKFNFLPEPIGDSIFAVASEEFGFIGAVGIVLLFVFFAFRGLKIAGRVPDNYGRLITVGIVIMIVSQAFVNIGAMVGILPLSGIPLPFISHGGTALFMTLAEIGIVLNVSKSMRKK